MELGNAQWVRRRWMLIALALIALGAVLRIERLGNALDYDEIWTLEDFATGTIREIFTRLSLPNNHPLNSLSVKWISSLSREGFALRLPAFAAGILTIPLAGMLSLMLFRRRSTALWTMLFAALSAPLALYSQLARGYSFQVFFCTLFWTGLAATGRFRPGRLRWLPEAALFLGGAGAILTLPTSILFLGAGVLPALPALRRGPRSVWVVLGVGAVLSLFWYGWNFEQFQEARRWGNALSGVGELFPWGGDVLWQLAGPLLILAAVAVFRCGRFARWIAVAALLPLLAAAATHAGPARAYLPLTIPIILLAGAGADWLCGRFRGRLWSRLLPAVPLLLAGYGFCRSTLPEPPDWYGIFQESSAFPPEVLILYPATDCLPLMWNNRPASTDDFLERLTYAGNSPRLVLLSFENKLNGLGADDSEQSVELPPDESRRIQLRSFAGYRYQLEEINKVPPPGSAVLAVVSPLPERELQTVARDIADSGDGWLRINSRLNRPIRFPDGTLRTALLLGARIATGSLFDPAAIRNAHPGRIRFYRMR